MKPGANCAAYFLMSGYTGVSMNFQFFRYALPLIQGEVPVVYDNGLPAFARPIFRAAALPGYVLLDE